MIRLSDHIAAAGGWLSLEAFMQLALHHPQEGYYSSSIENIGQRGDFSTTPTLSPILAKERSRVSYPGPLLFEADFTR